MLTDMTTAKKHCIHLISEDQTVTNSSKAGQAERILSKFQQIRSGVEFQIRRGRLEDVGGQNSDAVVWCGSTNTKVSELPKSLPNASPYAIVRPVRFPSTILYQYSPMPIDVVKGIDITFISEFNAESKEGDEALATKFGGHSSNAAIRLARYTGQFLRQYSPLRVVHWVESPVPGADAIEAVFSSEFPELILKIVSFDEADKLLASAPASLNGFVVGRSTVVEKLFQNASCLLGPQDILGSAYLPQQPEAGRPGWFSSSNSSYDSLLSPEDLNPLGLIQSLSLMLKTTLGLTAEAGVLDFASRRTLDPYERIGSEIRTADIGGNVSASQFIDKLIGHLDFALEALNSTERAKSKTLMQTPLSRSTQQRNHRRPMGIIEKILTHSAVGLKKDEVKPGDMVCVAVDWVLTSELLWGGMEKTYDQMKRPRPHRNDRLWIAMDHTVDPRTNHLPKQRELVARAEKFRDEAKIVEFLPVNTSIMHTDFTRERAQPGYVVVGSDSHTCSAGSMGAFAVGFGAADVVLPMVTGETWFRVPEVCNIHFVGKLPFGIGGKEVILYILGLLKRNTIAFQRAVEFTGPGLLELSMDARFAIANMTTEFGGAGACFEADEVTAAWVANRDEVEHQNRGLYFKPDPDAQYVEKRVIDLALVASTIAVYPNPDDVVPISKMIGMKLDGCFIGACTTTEEDLILVGLVLEAGLRSGLKPVITGKRRATPGSLIITNKLRKHGLIDVYNQAGFEIGAPGCSYCVGINDVDVAGRGEVWLSSQNRNFRNRMGEGSIGHVTSAAAVAASSFGMTVVDPAELLSRIDRNKYSRLIENWKHELRPQPEIVEPNPKIDDDNNQPALLASSDLVSPEPTVSGSCRIVKSKVQRFEFNVDTDAIIPAQFMPGRDDADLGSHCFEFYRPEFREKAVNGSRIIVGRHGFGSGSSREDAVRALKGAGIEAVIAEGFAFIYERNQLNLGLYNIILKDPEFYEYAVEDSVITIDKDQKVITIEGVQKEFRYEISELEETLLDAGGVLPLYNKYESNLFRQLIKPRKANLRRGFNSTAVGGCGSKTEQLAW